MSTKSPVEDIYPLTAMQQGMLFHALYQPEGGEYFEQTCCRLRGDLDLAAFVDAWSAVVRRHPALRTAFRWEKRDEPLQIVFRDVEVPCRQDDWRALSPAVQERALESLLEADVREGFDLRRPPLMRLFLAQVGEDERILLWSHHHLLLDGWCLGQVLSEVFSAYEAGLDGREAALPPARPFRDYVSWLRRQDLQAAEVFWRRQLEGFDGATPITFGTHAARGASPEGAAVEHDRAEVRLPAPVTARLRSFAQTHGLTLNTLAQGAWALLLSRFSGCREVLFGIVSSGRPAELPGVESIVGLFVNTLPLRVRVPPESAVLPWLRDLQRQQIELRSFEHTPLPSIRKWSSLAPEVQLFESILAFENHPLADLAAGGRLAISDVRVVERTNYPLTLTILPGEELALIMLFAAPRFTAAGMARLLSSLAVALEGLVRSPDMHLSQISLLSAAEERQIEAMSEGPHHEYPRDGTLVELFDARVAATPEAPAVVDGERRCNYRELQQLSAGIAARLRAVGVGVESVVPVCARGSLEYIAGILGVLRAGGTYLPLDPLYPLERQQLLMRDSGASVLLAQPDLAGSLDTGDLTLVLLGEDDPEDPEEGDTVFRQVVTPNHLAYLMYTSGSTGVPKAVAIGHRAVINLATQSGAIGVRPSDRMAQLSAISFDAATWEIWGALLAGACLVVTPREVLLEPAALGAFFRRHGVTATLLTTTFFHQVALAQPEVLSCLETLLFGGEAADAEAVRRSLAADPPRRLINVYGPTEATVVTTFKAFEALDPEATVVPIGRPAENYRVHLVDRDLWPVPVGVPGELLIGGDGLARGYHRRPRLTAERFVPDPFGTEPGGRIYRTGDLVRWREDGDAEFFDRLDDQVKVRGFRIELGEIEVALKALPVVREAVVTAPQGAGGGPRRLVAYVVAADGTTPAAEDLKAALEERLPSFMVPAVFVFLPSLPRTVSGKLDRRGLPDPDSAKRAEPVVAPRNAVEALLVRAWAETLGLEEVGVHDNFFDLGGDSILSIQVCSRLERDGLRLTPRQLFEEGTIARLAPVVEAARRHAPEQGPVEGPVALTPVERWFVDLDLVRPEHFNQGLALGFRGGEPPPAVLERALAALERHHDALRLRFEVSEDGWRQRCAPVSNEGPAFSVVECDVVSAGQEATLERVAEGLQTRLDLAVGPLWRAALVRCAGGRSVFFLVIHHLAVDAVSWRILLADLELACRQAAAGEPIRLPPKTTSFRRWAALLEESAAEPVLAADLEAWERRFGAWQGPLAGDPADPSACGVEGDAQTLERVLDESITESFSKRLSRSAGVRPETLLVAALALAWHEWSGEPRLLLHVERHGREEEAFEGVDLTRTVGWFTTLVPVPIAVPENAEPGAILAVVREALEAGAAGALRWGILRYLAADPEIRRRAAALPNPVVSFNYLGQLDLGGVAGGTIELLRQSAGPMRDPGQRRAHWLDVAAEVSGGSLRVELRYEPTVRSAREMERLAELLEERLVELITSCAEVEPPAERTVAPAEAAGSAFELAGVEDDDLQRALGEVEI